MIKGKLMDRYNVIKLANAFRKQIAEFPANYTVSTVLQDLQDLMIRMIDDSEFSAGGDKFEEMQGDCMIFMYLIAKVIQEETNAGRTPGILFKDSEEYIESASNDVITDEYARQIWAHTPDIKEYTFYGTQGEPVVLSGPGFKKRTFLDTITKANQNLPPSILLDKDGDIRLQRHSERQQHPTAARYRFIFGLYRIHCMWMKITREDSRLTIEDNVIYADIVDLTQPHSVLYKVTETEVAAMQVHLTQTAAMEIYRKQEVLRTQHAPLPTTEVDIDQFHIQLADEQRADAIKLRLCQKEDTETPHSIKAALIGPFPLQDFQRVEIELARFQKFKDILNVQPDLVYAKKMMYSVAAASATHCNVSKINLRENYTWAVYIPSLRLEYNHAIMTIQELEAMALEDMTIDEIAKNILRPILRSIAVMKETCGDYSNWRIDHNYISFDVFTQESTVIIRNARIHTITDTILDKYPDSRVTIPTNNMNTAPAIRSFLERERDRFEDAEKELARFKILMMEDKYRPNLEDTTPIPPPDHDRWKDEAMIESHNINALDKCKDSDFFALIDELREILDHLKRPGDAEFRFQRDDKKNGGIIYWDGLNRKWGYLLTKDTADCTPKEKKYLNILECPVNIDAFKRKIWVAMDTNLRDMVVAGNMKITKACRECSRKN